MEEAVARIWTTSRMKLISWHWNRDNSVRHAIPIWRWMSFRPVKISYPMSRPEGYMIGRLVLHVMDFPVSNHELPPLSLWKSITYISCFLVPQTRTKDYECNRQANRVCNPYAWRLYPKTRNHGKRTVNYLGNLLLVVRFLDPQTINLWNQHVITKSWFQHEGQSFRI